MVILATFFTMTAKHSNIDAVKRPPVPGIMQPVLRPVDNSRAFRVPSYDFPYDKRVSLWPVMVPMNFVDWIRDFPVLPGEPVITLEALPLESLHCGKIPSGFVGAVDQISRINQAKNVWAHLPATVLFRDWSSWKFPEYLDRSTVGCFRIRIKIRG